jgi:hypothetical protein
MIGMDTPWKRGPAGMSVVCKQEIVVGRALAESRRFFFEPVEGA